MPRRRLDGECARQRPAWPYGCPDRGVDAIGFGPVRDDFGGAVMSLDCTHREFLTANIHEANAISRPCPFPFAKIIDRIVKGDAGAFDDASLHRNAVQLVDHQRQHSILGYPAEFYWQNRTCRRPVALRFKTLRSPGQRAPAENYNLHAS